MSVNDTGAREVKFIDALSDEDRIRFDWIPDNALIGPGELFIELTAIDGPGGYSNRILTKEDAIRLRDFLTEVLG